MSCPTCDHTMHSLPAMPGGLMTWWCPRCGTLLSTSDAPGAAVHHDAPKLVEQCREFRKTRHPSFKAEVGLFGDPVLAAEWERSGIAESIHTPDQRPK